MARYRLKCSQRNNQRYPPRSLEKRETLESRNIATFEAKKEEHLKKRLNREQFVQDHLSLFGLRLVRSPFAFMVSSPENSYMIVCPYTDEVIAGGSYLHSYDLSLEEAEDFISGNFSQLKDKITNKYRQILGLTPKP